MAKAVSIPLTCIAMTSHCIAFLTIILLIWEGLRFTSLAEYSYTAVKDLRNILEEVAQALFMGV